VTEMSPDGNVPWPKRLRPKRPDRKVLFRSAVYANRKP